MLCNIWTVEEFHSFTIISPQILKITLQEEWGRRLRDECVNTDNQQKLHYKCIPKHVQVYLTNIYSMHVLCESVDCESSHFQMCSLQIWFPVCRPSETSSGYRLVLYTAHINISKTAWFLDTFASWSAYIVLNISLELFNSATLLQTFIISGYV